MPHTVYLALGSNLGDRLANLRAAVAALPPQVQPLSVSPVYETPPWGITDQPAFLNQALKAETSLPPMALLRYLKRLEGRLGRTVSVRYGPRKIDLDILFYDDRVVEGPRLIIPHPHLHERAFVLVPLAALAPNLMHPRLGKTILQLLSTVDRDDIRLVSPD